MSPELEKKIVNTVMEARMKFISQFAQVPDTVPTWDTLDPAARDLILAEARATLGVVSEADGLLGAALDALINS